jgi:hypothetical protein
LDESLVRELAIPSLRRGIGSMDYIDTLLIMEDYLDDTENVGELWQSSTKRPHDETSTQDAGNSQNPGPDPDPTLSSVPDWCDCGRCRPMPQEIENKCCKLKKMHYTFFQILKIMS